ncbi:alpha/beta hydrolase domain-containing protein [Streptomyces sp. DH37]|uniref:alpha/beta hydrolase domain-containing protein n=1 Tax=Streptomyces sp. DH37 TaxID=3040122 RepID=UPI0024418971|nr:alpha/beta hydrolase domain-containing protein [Streptomyces sp. DH37]MDG9701334.1 alpha/beta hydrolase domain-containing protein [Streptomyces sp. DH37]
MSAWRGTSRILLAALVTATLTTGAAEAAPRPAPAATGVPVVQGPVAGTAPGDPSAPDVEDTHPWMSTVTDLAAAGYVEEEFYLSGEADGYGTTGELVASDVPYTTRIVVRRPTDPGRFNGTVLTEWQNVTAGYDLDALWSPEQIIRGGYAWVGVSAQRVGVDHLRGWSPARYGDLDVTGRGRFTADELSYDVFAQAAKALRTREGAAPLGPLRARTVLGVGASQSAARMTVYYDRVLPRTEPVFDAYAHVVGTAPSRRGAEPVFHVLSETDVRTPVRRADDDRYRRWEVAGTAHSGWHGQEYRRPVLTRDLGAAPTYACDRPPFSRAPLHHVIAAAYGHLVRWADHGVQPPSAPPLEFAPDGTKARDGLGLARGGIRLSQVEVPTALNTGDNSGETFCFLFGTHVPFDRARLDRLYPSSGGYVSAARRADTHNVLAGYLLPGDALRNLREAVASGVGRR